jgi:transposase
MRMPARFINIDRDTPLLLPANMRDWVPESHLVHFMMDAVGELDLGSAQVNQRGTGSEQYPPGLLLGLLIYSYATGVFSSRAIERSTYENVAVRLLCADTHPDHDTLCAFRCRNAELLNRSFAAVLEMAARCGVLNVGGITVAIDGTKVLANASKHSAVSYERAGEQMRQLDIEIAALLRKAEEADATPLEDGLTIPEEVERRQERKAKLAKARAEMEARAYAQAQAERAEYERKVAAREARRKQGKNPSGNEPKPPVETPDPKDQYNFTDEESRMMKSGSGNHFEQAYNAQAAVEVDSRLIVGQRVSNAPNDKQQLVPSLEAVAPAAGPVREVLVDSGFVSEEAVKAVELNKGGEPTGVTVLAAMKRDKHGRTVEDLEKKQDPVPPPADAPFNEQMIHRVACKAGRMRYKLRQQTVEPVFGIIKEAMGFRRFSMRGQEKATLEWTLVTLAYNLKRLFTMGAQLAPQAG